MSTSLIEAAGQYASIGWRVVPTSGKKPFVRFTELLAEDPKAPVFLQNFERHPEAYGIALIVPKNLCVLDLDSTRAVEEFRELAKDAVGLKTSRGSKYIFEAPKNVNLRVVAGSAKFNIRDDVELILEGMLCEIPPGKHESGTIHYEWIKDPFNHDITLIPQKLFNEIVLYAETKENGTGFRPGELEELMHGAVEGEGRNQAAIRIAGHLIGKGNLWEVIETTLKGWNLKNKPPMQEKELSGILKSARKMYDQGQEENNQDYKEISHKELNNIRQTQDTLRLNIQLPEDHFITEFVDWSDSLNDGYREYKILTGFWLLSALVQQKCYIKLSTGTHYPNIWVFLIGPSTISRKTTIIDNGRGIYTAATGDQLPDTDYSLEGYAESLAANPVLNSVRDEASTILSKMGQKYNDGYFEFECSMYDGKPYLKTLASKGKGTPQTFRVEKTYITKLYATTPVKFASSLTTNNFDSGFGFRFLYAAPSYSRELKGHRRLTDEDTARWISIMGRTRKIYNYFKEAPEIAFGMDQDAEKFYDVATLNILKQLANEEYANETLLAVWGRAETYILKLAMLLEIGKKPMSVCITIDSLLASFQMVCEYFVPSTIAVYNQLLEDTRYNNIEKIIKELRKLRGIAPHRILLNKCKMTAKDFSECIDTMYESEAIDIRVEKGKNNKEAKTYILRNDNANIIPKDVFDLAKICKIFQSVQVPQVLQVPRFPNDTKELDNLESVRNFKQFTPTHLDNNPNIDQNTGVTLQQFNIFHALQLLSGTPPIREPENLGNLGNLDSMHTKPVSFANIRIVTDEEAARILEEEGY